MSTSHPVGAPGAVGDVLGGRYRLVRRLGTGGSATVFLAEDQRLGRQVAVKVLHPRGGRLATPRIEREARQAAALSHPYVVQVHDVVVTDDEAYIVMEHVAGTPLDELLRRDGPCSEERTAELGAMIAEALAAAHAEGIVHRDVKPSNVLVRPDGTAKLADFGTARMGHGDTLTDEGTLIGSAAYVAPEQVQASRDSDHRADLYSLGILLYELVTGVRPFEGDSVAATVIQRLHRDPLPPSAHRPVSPALEAVILRAMAREPADRYPDAMSLAGDLRATLERPLDATRPIPPLPTEARPRVGRVLGGAFLGASLVVGAALAAGWGSAVGSPEDAVVQGVTAVVPELRGLTSEDATAKAEAAGFRVVAVREVPGRSTAGTVVDQIPAAGAHLPTHEGIHLLVSSGPERLPVTPAPTTSDDGDAGTSSGGVAPPPAEAPEPPPPPPPPSSGGETQVEQPPAGDPGPAEGNGRGRPDAPGERGQGRGPDG